MTDSKFPTEMPDDEDWVKFDTVEKVAARFIEIREELRPTAQRLAELRGDLNLALYNLVRQTSIELTRLADWAGADSIDLVAWPTRSLYELSLYTRYVLQSNENLNRFILESVEDRNEILEGLSSLAPRTQVADELRSEAETWRRGVEQAGFKSERPMFLVRVAEALERKVEHDVFYKFLSKYVHRTSWLVNGDEDEVHQLIIRNMFLVKAQEYAREIVRLVGSALKSAESGFPS